MCIVLTERFQPIQNWTVNAHCYLTIDHFVPTNNAIEHLDVKTFGKVNVLTENKALTTLTGSTLSIRSGAEVRNTLCTSAYEPSFHCISYETFMRAKLILFLQQQNIL